MLFAPNVHEPLVDAPWDAGAAEAAIRDIALDAEAALRPGAWWALHPLDYDPGDPDVFHGLYLGAAGMVWGLRQLGVAGLPDVLESYRRRPEYEGPSLLMAEGGIALVDWLQTPSPALADRLFELVAPPADDTLELMWGSPGQLVIADVMAARSGEPRWADASARLVEHLLARCDADGLWTQELYGRTRRHLGPAHGAAGVIAALGPRAPARAIEAISALAVREGDLANWPVLAGEGLGRNDTIRVQWCHGAPGIVTSLAAEEELLLAGGELTWVAGPLRKGAGLCHGTAGNGFAFLKLFTLTGDERWLERARRFAMHAIAQVAAARAEYGTGRHSLWTGDLGAALYLQQCLAGESALPTLDLW